MGYKSDWLVKSNAESGAGYSDILVEIPDNRTGIVVELEYAQDGDMYIACEKALQQIEDKNYDTDMMFMYAWNEWAEGGYLEPDERSGYKNLEAIKTALEKNGEFPW